MARDFFSHAVYGIVLSGKDVVFLEGLFDKFLEDDLSSDEALDAMLSSKEYLDWAKRKGEADFPLGASLFLTDDEDDYPGRCMTAPRTWIVGWGLFGFPYCAWQIPQSFEDKAEWHCWVTCG